MRRHSDQGCHRDDAGAADPGDHDVAMTWSKWRIGKLREKRIINTGALRFTRLGTANGDEGRAEAIRAAIIFVAARLIDRPLAPEGGFLRDDADAARLNGAIAACFTNRTAERRVGHELVSTCTSGCAAY